MKQCQSDMHFWRVLWLLQISWKACRQWSVFWYKLLVYGSLGNAVWECRHARICSMILLISLFSAMGAKVSVCTKTDSINSQSKQWFFLMQIKFYNIITVLFHSALQCSKQCVFPLFSMCSEAWICTESTDMNTGRVPT